MKSRASRHRALRDSFQADVLPGNEALALELEERDPSLLDLPIPIPTIPILAPILTIIVGGKTITTTSTISTATTPATTPTTTTTTPETTPSTSAGTGSGSGAGAGAGSGSGSGSGSDSGSGSGSGSGTGSGSGSGSSGTGSGAGSGAGAGAGDSGSNSGSSSAGGASNPNSPSGSAANPSNPSASGSSGSLGSDPAGGAEGSSKHSSATGGVLAAAQPTPGGDGNNALPSGPTSVVVTGGKTMTVIGSVTYTTGIPMFTGTSGSGGNGGGGSGANSDSEGKHGLPSYVAAIVGVLGAFGFIALAVFAIRRRAVNKRAARKHWWASVIAPADSDRKSRESSGATAGNVSSTRSIRSSFGTTFDHSEFSITFDDNDVPSLPPMAEIRGGPGLVPKGDSSMSGNGQPLSPISPISATSPVLPIPLLVSIENSNVFSDANRRSSTGSSASAQYLNYDRETGAANHQLLTPEASTPMSVRPFSPTESFAFPSPPREHRSSAWVSAATSPVPMITESLVPSAPPTARYSENPFADAFSVPLTNRASAEFDAIETIWRPFEQTLQDEMTVHAGDSVKVLAVYDDGWAMIERVGMGKGKGKAPDGKASVGLIPIDCMRRAEESVSSFLAAKRVSSVDATGYTAMAV